MKRLLRPLYGIYQWLILAPVLLVSTLFFGTLAIVMVPLAGPRFARYYSGLIWARVVAWATPVRVRVVGREHIDPDQSYVIVSNHLSHYDVLTLYGWLEIDFKWVMKKELKKLPMIGYACHKLDHIFIDRANRAAAIASLNEARQNLSAGTSILFFPEGTRSRSGHLMRFKKGAFKMAVDLDLPILPVALVGTRDVMPADSWHVFPGQVFLIFHPPVATDEYNDDTMDRLMENVRETIQTSLDEYRRREHIEEYLVEPKGEP